MASYVATAIRTSKPEARIVWAVESRCLAVLDQERMLDDVVDFPRDLAYQSPAPLGLADLKMSPLSPEAKSELKQDLSANITDPAVLAVVMSRLDEILRDEPPNWEDASSWTDYVSKAKERSAGEPAR